MGYERADGTVMGDIDRFAHTGLWEFASDESGEYAYSTGNYDTALWFKGVEGENVYVEAVISATKLNNFDGYPKFGLLVRNDYESRWGFIDAVGFNQNNTAAGMVYRGFADGSQSNWDWGSALWGGATGCNFANTKLAIAKVGNQLYFLVNDEIYITTTFEGNVVVGFESFNLEVTISDVVTSTDVEFIQKQLREKRNITVVGENEGVKVDNKHYLNISISHIIERDGTSVDVLHTTEDEKEQVAYNAKSERETIVIPEGKSRS